MARSSFGLVALAAMMFATVQGFHAPAPLALCSRVVSSRQSFTMDDKDMKKIIKTKSGLGRTVDQDGKSNVWAVEPKMRVDNSETNLADPKIIAGIAAAILAVVAIPLFPTLFSAANGF
jgi:hypothetical protein